MTLEEIHQKLSAQFGDAIGELQGTIDRFSVVPADRLIEICTWLRDTPGVEMNFLIDETATDHPDENLIRVVYYLFSYSHRHGIELKVELDRAAPSVHTVEDLWPVANWFEREVMDLFGVDFVNHSDLRRIMLPDDWEGHPLLKDYGEPESYHGINHFRPSPIAGFTRMDEFKRRAAQAAAEAEAAEAAEAAGETTDTADTPAEA